MEGSGVSALASWGHVPFAAKGVGGSVSRHGWVVSRIPVVAVLTTISVVGQ